MNDLERERDFYRQQCNELGARLLRQQEEQARARQAANYSRTSAILIREVYQLTDARMSLAEIAQRFLHILRDTLHVDRVTLLKYQPESGRFVAEHTLGFPKSEPVSFTPSELPAEYYFVNSTSPATPLGDCLRQAAGVPYLAWTFDVKAGLALLLGNVIEDQHLHRPFEIGFREILEGSLTVFVDVTVRQRTEAALSDSEERFRQVVSSITDHLYMTELTAEGKPVNRYLSPNVTDLTGYPLERFLNDWGFWPSLIHPDDRAAAAAQVEQFRQGRRSEVEYRLTRADGEVIWVRDSGRVDKSPDGQGVVIYGVVSHISERRETEAALRQSEVRSRALLDAVPDLIIRFSRDGVYLDVKEARDIPSIIPLDQIIGRNMADVLPPEVVERQMRHIEQALDSGETRVYEQQFVADGQIKYEEVRVVPSGESEVLIVFQDITERKQTETLLAKRAAELETVAGVSTAAATILDTDRLLQEVVDLTRARFNLYHAHIYLLNEPGDSLALAAGAGQVGRQMVAEGWHIPLEREQSLVARAARTRQGVIVNDVQAEPGFLPNPLLPETRSELAVPLLIGDRVLGVLDVQADEAGRFTGEDVRIQTILAAQIAVALENAGQYQRTQAALAEIQQSQVLLRSIIDATPDWIFIKDQEHRYRLANQGYANDLHLKPEDFIGKTDLELGFPEELVKGDPEKGIRGFWTDDRLVMDSGETQVYPNDPATIDGELHVFHTIKAPLRDAKGNIWGVLAFARDITEREKLLAEMQQSQQMLRSVIDATPDWILVKDREHRFRLVNQGFADSLHLRPDEIVGKNDIELGIPEEIVKGDPDKGIRGFWADDLEVMENGQVKIIEAEPTVIDGKPAFLNTIKVPMRDASGEAWGVLAYIRNITTLKQTEESLAKRANELTCLNDIGREMESTPRLPELLQWVTERIPPAMQYPELCLVAIEYGGRVYGQAKAIDLPTQMTHGLYIGGEILGRIYIAYTEKYDFLNEESALLGGIATRLGGYLENRRLFEQVQARAQREQILREVTDRIRGSVDVDTIMRTAAQEVGKALARPAFVYLGQGGNGQKPATGQEEKEA